ncbi:phage shock protein C (PspC) family protein [Pseudonocardia hierapolitana]|uniref:Phage shock protein C (PspC) family protein n=1 Tax=Pseudonocardia hierapolitana TaxID=1128676 RepID=A0A561SZH6_9PSEU|nr:PspC domain-containing protein [Pseudonocardia hierapolitana]TWF80276.1 phage shock protein C (PspC) family protein [Pseudonocardia hierapolitana]
MPEDAVDHVTDVAALELTPQMCAGLGRRIGLDPWPARLLFVGILLIVPGSQLLIYPILWILMPNEAPAGTFVPESSEKGTASAA